MTDQNSNIQPGKISRTLFPVDGKERRVYPQLWSEVGRDAAELLLQLDEWIATEGVEREGHWWVKISTTDIMQRSFYDWNQHKIRQVLRELRQLKLIVVKSFDTPLDPTPYFRLHESIQYLQTVRYIPLDTTSHSQPKRGYQLQLIDQSHLCPLLRDEIGLEPAALLLQLDYWIGSKGFERDGHRWIKMPTMTILQLGFQTWSQAMMLRQLYILADEKQLIIIDYLDGPDTVPYIRLNKDAIRQLKGVRIIDDNPPPLAK